MVSRRQKQENIMQNRDELLEKMLKAFLGGTLSLGQACTDAPTRPLQAHMERQEGT